MDPTPHLLLPRGRERRALSNRHIHSTSSLSGFLLSICTFLPLLLLLLLLWPIFCFLNKKWAITGLFFSLFSSFQQLIVNMFIIKSCRWLDLNYGPLVSEVTALPTEPQPLPQALIIVFTRHEITTITFIDLRTALTFSLYNIKSKLIFLNSVSLQLNKNVLGKGREGSISMIVSR